MLVGAAAQVETHDESLPQSPLLYRAFGMSTGHGQLTAPCIRIVTSKMHWHAIKSKRIVAAAEF